MARLPDEFALIARYFAPLAAGCPGALGLEDDAATIAPSPGAELVVTADALVAGVHFLQADPADLVARKALRVNLSDLAAKGARPTFYLMTLALDRATEESWIAAFARGLAADQAEYGVSLAGGDTTATPGPTVISITALGEVAAGTALRRTGARAGDLVFVSGTLGDGALGLAALAGELDWLDGGARAYLADRYRLPRPRTGLGPRLVGLAHAALDVSDGLVADLGHLADASGLAAGIEVAAVPLSAAAAAVVAREPERIGQLLAGGDDYEIVFAAPPERQDAIEAVGRELGVPLACIGRLAQGAGVTVRAHDGRPVTLARPGYRHF